MVRNQVRSRFFHNLACKLFQALEESVFFRPPVFAECLLRASRSSLPLHQCPSTSILSLIPQQFHKATEDIVPVSV